MTNLLNQGNSYCYSIGNRVSSSIEIFPKQKMIKLSFDDGSNFDGFYCKIYSFTDTKKANYFCNRIVKEMKRVIKIGGVLNFSYYNSILKKDRYSMIECLDENAINNCYEAK